MNTTTAAKVRHTYRLQRRAYDATGTAAAWTTIGRSGRQLNPFLDAMAEAATRAPELDFRVIDGDQWGEFDVAAVRSRSITPEAAEIAAEWAGLTPEEAAYAASRIARLG
jgi:hypothetical protein